MPRAAFIDDTYKITPKVTLALGLRYELTPPWVDRLNNDFTVAIPQLYFAPPGSPIHLALLRARRQLRQSLPGPLNQLDRPSAVSPEPRPIPRPSAAMENFPTRC